MKNAPESDALVQQAAATIRSNAMLPPGASVLAAVSGGVDSMVMLDVLCRLGYRVEAAHFDHETRNGASAEDAAFVQQACAEKSIPCHVASENVVMDATESGRSFEEYARERRYTFLMEKAAQSGCYTLATAHHEDDQAETMLMGILGISSGFGINGMRPVYEHSSVRIIRPLLQCSRDAIMTYAQKHGILWRDDATNAETCCTRNRVRLDLLPLLRGYNPQAARALARLADIMQIDSEYLEHQARKILAQQHVEQPPFVLDKTSFLDIHEAVQRRLLKLLVQELGVSLSYERTLSAIAFIAEGVSGGMLELGGDVVLHLTDTQLFLQCQGDNSEDVAGMYVPLKIPGDTVFGEYQLQARILNQPDPLPTDIREWCSPTKQYFDADKLTGNLYVRSRQRGDRMIPLGTHHSCKVQDILVNLHIPSFQRDEIPLVMIGEELLWIAGHKRSRLAAVDSNTTRLLELQVCSRDL